MCAPQLWRDRRRSCRRTNTSVSPLSRHGTKPVPGRFRHRLGRLGCRAAFITVTAYNNGVQVGSSFQYPLSTTAQSLDFTKNNWGKITGWSSLQSERIVRDLHTGMNSKAVFPC